MAFVKHTRNTKGALIIGTTVTNNANLENDFGIFQPGTILEVKKIDKVLNRVTLKDYDHNWVEVPLNTFWGNFTQHFWNEDT